FMKKKTALFTPHEKTFFAVAIVLGVSFISTSLVSVAFSPRVSTAQAVPRDRGILTEWIRPGAQGGYREWTPTPPDAGDDHFSLINEEACDKNETYVATRVANQRELYRVDLAAVPDGATISEIELDFCASNDVAGAKKENGVMVALYRFNNGRLFEGRKAAVSGVEPGRFPLAQWRNLRLVKNATSSLEVGMRLSGGLLGARVSRVAARVRYTPRVVPAAPTNLRADNGNGMTTLQWQDNAQNEQGFKIDYTTQGLDGPWVQLVRTERNVRSYQHRNPPVGIARYRVIAFDNQGDSDAAMTSGLLTIALDTDVAPAAPSLVNVGTADYLLGAVKLRAQDEDQVVASFQVTLEGVHASANDVRNVRVFLDDGAVPLVSTPQLNATATGGVFSWLAPDKLFEIQNGAERTLRFVADIAPAGFAKLGDDVRIDIDQAVHVTSVGKMSGAHPIQSLLSNNAIAHTIQPFTVTVAEAIPAYPASNLEANVSTGTLLAKFKILNSGPVAITTTQFKIYNDGSCTFASVGYRNRSCSGGNVHYALKTSDENADNTSYLISGAATHQSGMEDSIVWKKFDGTLAQSDKLVIGGGRYRTFGVYISSTIAGFARDSRWQFMVGVEGDMTFSVVESVLGYDANLDGDRFDVIGNTSTTGLRMRGRPSLPSVTDKQD
ncbi:MAG: hypothetical protein HY437_02270, partial [Candidatus Magasanikbacteria bacterium]|nr:hypothetical protein [Candidatus Magasanikbacteria bacterium]